MRITCSHDSRAPVVFALSIIASGLFASGASAQWAAFINDTSIRMPTGAGQNASALTTADPEEKDFAWADLDNDGDLDMVSVRKTPFTFAGGRRNVLYMNEGGMLIDRASTKANTSINVPAGEITAANGMSPAIPGWLGSSQGFLDPTNDRDVVIGDVNNDGWLDVVTATTISDVDNSSNPYYLPRFLGHPRVYINLGEVAGVWQGLRYDYNRIPQMSSKTGTPWHPRFCSVAIGDVTGDGYADLYFGDYDTAEVGPFEPAGTDFDNKLLVNRGLSQPGVFDDSLNTRINGNPGLLSAFGAASIIADMNGDGFNDIVKQTGLDAPQHIAISYNDPGNVGHLNNYVIVTALSPYFVSAGDLNNDGRLDLVVTDDNVDHYHLNQGGTGNFSSANFIGSPSGDFGSQSAIADLDNDGFRDVLISDVDVDGFGCARRMHIYHNMGDVPNVTLREELPSIISTGMLTGTYQVAPFDLNGDGWNDLVVGRCNSTEVWMNSGLKLALQGTLPSFVNPATGAIVNLTITKSPAASIVAGTARLFVSVNSGAFSPIALTPLGGSNYSATLPAGACGDNLRYYFTASATFGGNSVAVTLPTNAPTNYYSALRATGMSTTLDEAFEGSVATWTVQNVNLTSGQWQAADPNGTVNLATQAAPEDDNTPAPGVKAFVTQNGAAGDPTPGTADVDGGPTHLLSPTLDATVDGAQHRIAYSYWFYTADASADTLTVAVSNNNGASWTTVKTYNATSSGWVNDSFLISTFVPLTNQVRVRFSAIDGLVAGVGSIVEAGVDDFKLEKALCAAPCPADVDGSTSVNINDLLEVINNWGPCPPPCPPSCTADIDGSDCQVNINDLLLVINAWGPCP